MGLGEGTATTSGARGVRQCRESGEGTGRKGCNNEEEGDGFKTFEFENEHIH